MATCHYLKCFKKVFLNSRPQSGGRMANSRPTLALGALARGEGGVASTSPIYCYSSISLSLADNKQARKRLASHHHFCFVFWLVVRLIAAALLYSSRCGA